ncbi:MAG: sigma-70 family RNA polymerase sigma factor [Bacteroidetes bacterium]|nr:sigma-70 family RNA polymerase sigma factor [Bacteroidota bacterium]
METQLLKEGSHETFLDVYQRMHIKLFRFFLKHISLHDAAKDLTQQCFIRLWQYRESLSCDHPLEKQIFIIARSILINHIKKETTQKKAYAAHQRFSMTAVAPAGDIRLEQADEVNAAIESLPPVRKRIMILKAMHGYSNKEIAQSMKISVKTVEDHITKAFRHIRQVTAMLLLIFFHKF